MSFKVLVSGSLKNICTTYQEVTIMFANTLHSCLSINKMLSGVYKMKNMGIVCVVVGPDVIVLANIIISIVAGIQF